MGFLTKPAGFLAALSHAQSHCGDIWQQMRRIHAVITMIGRINDQGDFVGLWAGFYAKAPGLE